MQETCDWLWRGTASGIRPQLSADAFQRWFASIELVQADEITLTFQVPNSIYQFWIESNYLDVMRYAAMSVSGVRQRSNSGAAGVATIGPASMPLLTG